MTFFKKVLSKASLSSDEKYRHWLMRRWSDGLMVTFIMLNPSTADASKDDPTIRKCIGFAKRWGYGALSVVNLFDYRSTSVKNMKQVSLPASDKNYGFTIDYCSLAYMQGGKVIAAWGTHGNHMGRNKYVLRALKEHSIPLHHLGLTKDGHPRHPLYIPYSQKPKQWTYP